MRAIALPDGAEEFLCGRCDGLWLPGAVVRAGVGEAPRGRLPAAAPARGLRCPADASALVPLRHHGVDIDVCPRCSGVWLDAGERERILAARATPARRESIDLAGAADLVEIGVTVIDAAGDVADKLLEFVADAFSAL